MEETPIFSQSASDVGGVAAAGAAAGDGDGAAGEDRPGVDADGTAAGAGVVAGVTHGEGPG